MINKFSILNEAKYFLSGIFQNILVFMPAKKYVKYFSATTRTDFQISSEMPKENIENITKSDINFAPIFVHHHVLPDINFDGHCLMNNSIPTPKKVINQYKSMVKKIYIYNTNFTLKNDLFGSVNLTKNAGPQDLILAQNFNLQMGKVVFIFGADMRSSVHIDSKNKDILILVEGPTQG